MPAVIQYRLIDNISLTGVDDELVILNLDTGAYYGLNHVGAGFVRALQNKSPIEQTVHEIADRYQMDYSEVRADMDRLIEQLLEQNLLTEVTEA